MYINYCKVVEEEDSQEILLLFALDRKLWWKVMPMGALNTALIFVTMIMKLQTECDTYHQK